MQTETLSRVEVLHSVARNYVLNGLGGKDFDAIPYHKDVVLRAPICPGGSQNPLIGKENLRTQWWAPLPTLLAGVDLIDSYANIDESVVTVEFHCHITQPACTLRIVDRFTINEEGEITEQENFFDPRDITNPGWR
jgi:hypothetical protein